MAVAISFNELEKIIQEKLFYKLLFNEYYQNNDLIGSGFRMTKYDFIINMVLVRPFNILTITKLAEKIGEKYNLFVEKNVRHEKPRWSLDYPTPSTYTYSLFITSEHDETNLCNENLKKMLVE